MELLPLVCVSLLTWSGTTFAAENEPKVITVEEGKDVILHCSLSTEDITLKLFEWKKDGQRRVYLYDGSLHHDFIRGQDPQFIGRVSHFPDELKSGNASITIKSTKVADSGNYTCEFPDLQPEQIFHIKLVVVGAAPEPSITILDETKEGVLLQCAVRGVYPKPEVEWQDSEGKIIPAEDPQVSERGGRFDVILRTTVNKASRFRCVATQKEISHTIHAETYVPFKGEGL
ncbi:butyrophilin-like protein 1 isoform X2 [Scomber scombrus]